MKSRTFGPAVAVGFTLILLLALEIFSRFFPFDINNLIETPRAEIEPYTSSLEIPNSLHRLKLHSGMSRHFVDKERVQTNNYFDSLAMEWPLKANFVGHQKIWNPNTNAIYFNGTATLNAHRQRIARDPEVARASQNHILFMGCSFTFGDGLNDWQTLPWKFNELQGDLEAYNLGIPGAGANTMWVGLHHSKVLDSVKQRTGIAVYMFFHPHFERTLGSMRVSGTRGGSLPLVVDRGGVREWVGTFESENPVQQFFYRWLAKSKWLENMGFDFPRMTPKRYRQFVRLVADLKAEYLRKFGATNRFVFVLYPNRNGDRYDHKELVVALEEQNIAFLDYSSVSLAQLVGPGAKVFGDGHPSEKSNAMLANLLVRDLK